LSSANNYNGLTWLFSSVWLAQFQKPDTSEYEHLLQWKQNRSQAMTRLLYNSSYSRVTKMFLVDWRLFVACFYRTTPRASPSTTRGTPLGPPVAVNIDFLDISDLWALVLSELYGYSTPLTTFQVNKNVRFMGQCWYFNPQWTPVAAINKASSVWSVLLSWDKMCSYYVGTL
jgi:hypothetical protein